MTKQIDRAFLRQLREDVEVALAAVGKRNGVLLSLGRATFTSESATFKMEVALATGAQTAAVAGGASAKDVKAASDYTAMAKLFGMKPEWLGQSFKWNGKELRIVGLLPNKRKNNVFVEGTGGGKYIMSPEEVIPCF